MFKYMRFLQIINNKKFTLINIFLLLYVIFNFFDGDRGFISYYKNKEIKKQLVAEKELLISDLLLIEKKNSLLTNNIDLDYLEILYRTKFMVGKSNEKFFHY